MDIMNTNSCPSSALPPEFFVFSVATQAKAPTLGY